MENKPTLVGGQDMPPIIDDAYELARSHMEEGQPVGMVPCQEGIWITAVKPVPVETETDIIAVAIASCVRARKEAMKNGAHPIN